MKEIMYTYPLAWPEYAHHIDTYIQTYIYTNIEKQIWMYMKTDL